MKQKFTITAILILLTVVSFGQKKMSQSHKELKQYEIRRHSGISKQEGSKHRPDLVQQRNGNLSRSLSLKTNQSLQKGNTSPIQNSSLKSTKSIIQRLDSLLIQTMNYDSSFSSNKVEFSYDANGNAIQELSYQWNESEWAPSGKNDFTYDAFGNIKMNLYYYLDPSTTLWVAGFKIESKYDANGRKTQDLTYYWDQPTSQWLISSGNKRENTYDNSGNQTQYANYEWDVTTSKWMGTEKGIMVYDVAGNITQDLRYDWNEVTDQWVVSSKFDINYEANSTLAHGIYYYWDEAASQWVAEYKEEITFDASGNEIQDLGYFWDESTSQWVADNRDEITYNANGEEILYLRYKWDESTSQMVARYREESTYDANGNRTQNINYEWDEPSSQWVAHGKVEHTYDANSNMTQTLQYEWDELTSQLGAYSKVEYTYDNLFSFADLLLPYFYRNDFTELNVNNMPLSLTVSTWDQTGNQWIEQSNEAFYYSEQNITSVSETNEVVVNVFPNPVSDKISFTFSGINNQITFQLYDIQGRKLFDKKIITGENVSLAEVNKGIYLYLLISDGHTQSGKLIKE